MVFCFFSVRTLKLQSNMTKNTIFDWCLMMSFVFSILLFDFVGFWKSRIKFFPMKKLQPCFTFYDLREVLLGEKTNDSRLTVITISVVRHVPRASSGSFLARTASQSQRGGSIINMKGTESDRSKASINKGVWIAIGNGSWDVMTPSVRKSRLLFP